MGTRPGPQRKRIADGERLEAKERKVGKLNMVEIRYHDLHLSSGGVAVEIKNGEFRYTSETVPGASTLMNLSSGKNSRAEE